MILVNSLGRLKRQGERISNAIDNWPIL